MGVIVLKSAGSLASFITYASATPMMYRIYKNKSTGEKSHFPLVAMLANCHIWSVILLPASCTYSTNVLLLMLRRMMYWLMKHNIFPIWTSTFTGELLSIAYISVYLKFTTNRPFVLKTVGIVVAILLIVSIYVLLGVSGVTNQTHNEVKDVLGYIADLASICFFASPTERIKRVLETKSVAPIPIQMCCMGVITNSLWVAYGFASHDPIVIIPNVISLGFTTTQLVLYVIYMPHGATAAEEEAFDSYYESSDVPTITVVISPKQGLTTKPAAESPHYRASESPLTPLQTRNLTTREV